MEVNLTGLIIFFWDNFDSSEQYLNT